MSNEMISVSRDLAVDLLDGLRITQERARKELRALLAKPAEQPRGEPVAHCFLRRNGAGEWINDAKSWADGVPCRDIVEMCEKNSELYQLRMAYAEQPAPVAVVLPERDVDDIGRFTDGWNACLDEVARLNPPQQ